MAKPAASGRRSAPGKVFEDLRVKVLLDLLGLVVEFSYLGHILVLKGGTHVEKRRGMSSAVGSLQPGAIYE